jgi:hypothetical protein
MEVKENDSDSEDKEEKVKSGFNAVDLPALSVENEVRALKRLKDVVTRQLDDYDETYAEDIEILENGQINQNERNCILMRSGEKKVT